MRDCEGRGDHSPTVWGDFVRGGEITRRRGFVKFLKKIIFTLDKRNTSCYDVLRKKEYPERTFVVPREKRKGEFHGYSIEARLA